MVLKSRVRFIRLVRVLCLALWGASRPKWTNQRAIESRLRFASRAVVTEAIGLNWAFRLEATSPASLE